VQPYEAKTLLIQLALGSDQTRLSQKGYEAKRKNLSAAKTYSTMTSSEDSVVSRIKTGASLLASGGTLTSEPCHKCSGVQVRLGDKITCINCGNEVNIARGGGGGRAGGDTPAKAERDEASPSRRVAVLTSAASLIEEKIALLASEIRAENDISIQRQKAELLERYLGILEKTKNLIG
jgi:uncharacterized Zn finger protein (UPF0148 family)